MQADSLCRGIGRGSGIRVQVPHSPEGQVSNIDPRRDGSKRRVINDVLNVA